MRISSLGLIGLTSLLLVGFGCSPSSIATSAIEAGLNAKLGTKGSVDLDNGNVTVHDNESGTDASYGSNVTLPSDFPSDVPILDGATLVGVAVAEDGAWATFTTSESVSDVTAWYESTLTGEGWTKQGTYAASGTTSMTFEKDSSTIAIIAASSDGTTSVTVTKSNK